MERLCHCCRCFFMVFWFWIDFCRDVPWNVSTIASVVFMVVWCGMQLLLETFHGTSLQGVCVNGDYLFHRLFQALGVLGHLQGIQHLLDVAVHEIAEVVHGEVDAVVGDAVLRVVVGPDLG